MYLLHGILVQLQYTFKILKESYTNDNNCYNTF